MCEIWKDIPRYLGTYQASNYGNIKRIRASWRNISKAGRILSPMTHSAGYKVVTLADSNGRYNPEYVHRLVLEAFIGPCPDQCECNHKDSNKRNNPLENLEWVSHFRNMEHNTETTGRMRGSRNCNAKLDEDKVISIRKLFSVGHSHDELASTFHISARTIDDVVTRKTWRHL